jgi:argininosuccinate lyase
MRFAPQYVANVLNENFEDAKSLFLEPLIALHYAHLVMLAECAIVSPGDAHQLRGALDAISQDEIRAVTYDGTCEDLFFFVERLIERACGADVAGRLHTARSRNDIDMTMYRMRQRLRILDLVEATVSLRRSLIEVAERHRETVFPAHTHTQPAQASTVAHYLLGGIEQLGRDATRLASAYATTNRNPLGACAITGTGFPIDRHRTAELLGFDGPTGNTYGSIATIDYTLEGLSATITMLVGLGRLLQDLLLWCTLEFDYLRLPDGFVQGSSIMPQKRNPVALEHARAISSKALGQALGVMTAVHNTPFGDIVDTEDDLQPLVDAAYRDAHRAVTLVAAAMSGADVNRELMAARARQHWITITELADTLARDHGLTFRQGHEISGALISASTAQPQRPLHEVLAEASRDVTGSPIGIPADALADLLSPEHFVRVRRTFGGPAPGETARALRAERDSVEADAAWAGRARGALTRAAETLRSRAAEL